MEIKIDRSTLPKDGQKVKWQTGADAVLGNWRYGRFSDGEDMFCVGFNDTVIEWDLAYNVEQWEKLSKEELLRAKQQEMSDTELIEQAEKQILKLAETKGASHTMSIPPKVTDTDMLLGELLRRFTIIIKS